MAKEVLMMNSEYEVEDKEKFFKHFMFCEDVNVGETWSDKNAPSKLVFPLKEDEGDPFVYEHMDDKLEIIEVYENDRKPFYVSEKDLVQLTKDGAISPVEDSNIVIVNRI